MGWRIPIGIAGLILLTFIGWRVANSYRDGGPYIWIDGDQLARFVASDKPAPLIVSLPTWSYDHRSPDDGLIGQAEKLGWNYIRPQLAGPNNTPEACCSNLVIERLQAAIDYSKANGNVADGEVFIVGVSGGGYTSLCALMSEKINAAAFYAWVPITDLVAWRRQQTGRKYANDIEQCAAVDGAYSEDEAKRRSPYFMDIPTSLPKQTVKIYAGVHDGWMGSVPISHSVRMFNRLSERLGGEKVSSDELEALFELRQLASDTKETAAGRKVHLHRKAGTVELVIFEGDHELMAEQVIADIQARLAR